jgi:hypothetical protein
MMFTISCVCDEEYSDAGQHGRSEARACGAQAPSIKINTAVSRFFEKPLQAKVMIAQMQSMICHA